ncbi:MAG: hypothetical protein KGI38_04475 [Thaumarchaeota archaeon]|nr:hypothetical protein [Nitrososphaerota archaeon]
MKIELNGYVPAGAVAVKVKVSVRPGGMPAAVPTENDDTEAVRPEDVKLQTGKKLPAGQLAPPTDQPLGATTETPVMVYTLLPGLDTVTEKVVAVAPPPRAGLLLVTDMLGRLALDAKAGVATGTRMRRPEIARSARIVPELNFVTYAFVSVFNIFILTGLNGLFKVNGQIVHFSRIFAQAGRWTASKLQTNTGMLSLQLNGRHFMDQLVE